MSETITLNNAKPWEDVDFLIKLYTKKRWSLNRISRHLGCSRYSVRKVLESVGVGDFKHKSNYNIIIYQKVASLRKKGLGYRRIANLLNIWGVKTRSGRGSWHAKGVRDILESH